MAKGPKRPKIGVVRIMAGALQDGAARGLVVAPMAAVAFAAPWMILFEAIRSFPRSNGVIAAALALTLSTILLLGVAMQSLLVEAGSTNLRRSRPSWRIDLLAMIGRYFGDLVISLIGLGLSAVACLVIGITAAVTLDAVAPGTSHASWWAEAAAVLAMVPAAILQAPWAVALPVSHVEGLGVVGALQRSVALTRGQRLRISIPQALYLAAWPTLGAIFIYVVMRYHLQGKTSQAGMALLFFSLGVAAAVEALGKVRLYRELAGVEGAVGASALAEVFG